MNCMLFIIILLLAGALFLIREERDFLKNRYYLLLAVASAVWWIYLVVNQLNTHLDCPANDSFCNSGNTVSGDVTWGSMIAIVTLLVVWVPAVLIGYILKRIKSKTK